MKLNFNHMKLFLNEMKLIIRFNEIELEMV